MTIDISDNTTLEEQLAKNLRVLLDYNKLSISEFSRAISISRSNVYAWLDAKSLPRRDTISNIEYIFNLRKGFILSHPGVFASTIERASKEGSNFGKYTGKIEDGASINRENFINSLEMGVFNTNSNQTITRIVDESMNLIFRKGSLLWKEEASLEDIKIGDYVVLLLTSPNIVMFQQVIRKVTELDFENKKYTFSSESKDASFGDLLLGEGYGATINFEVIGKVLMVVDVLESH